MKCRAYRVLYWNAHAKNKEPVTVYGPETYDKCLGYYEVMFQHRPTQYSMQRVEDANSLPEEDYVKVSSDISRPSQYTVPSSQGRNSPNLDTNVAQKGDVHERIKRLQKAVKSNSSASVFRAVEHSTAELPDDVLLV